MSTQQNNQQQTQQGQQQTQNNANQQNQQQTSDPMVWVVVDGKPMEVPQSIKDQMDAQNQQGSSNQQTQNSNATGLSDKWKSLDKGVRMVVKIIAILAILFLGYLFLGDNKIGNGTRQVVEDAVQSQPYNGQYSIRVLDDGKTVVELDYSVQGNKVYGTFGGESIDGTMTGDRLNAKSNSWEVRFNKQLQGDRVKISGTVTALDPGIWQRWFGTSQWSISVTPGWR